MASYITRVNVLNTNISGEVTNFLKFLKENKAKVIAYEKSNSAVSVYAIITKHRKKETK